MLLRTDGEAEARLVASSPFPRHSLYGPDRTLVDVFGSAELQFDEDSPWHQEPAAFADSVASRLERRLAESILRARRHPRSTSGPVAERHSSSRATPAHDLFVLLDGLLDVEIDGEVVAQIGSGAILGERAALGDGRRTATLRAV